MPNRSTGYCCKCGKTVKKDRTGYVCEHGKTFCLGCTHDCEEAGDAK